MKIFSSCLDIVLQNFFKIFSICKTSNCISDVDTIPSEWISNIKSDADKIDTKIFFINSAERKKSIEERSTDNCNDELSDNINSEEINGNFREVEGVVYFKGSRRRLASIKDVVSANKYLYVIGL